MIKAVSDVKETIEEQKFTSEVSVEDVSKWSDGIEKQIEFTDKQVRKIAKQIRDINYKMRMIKTEQLKWSYNNNTNKTKEMNRLHKKLSFWIKNLNIKKCLKNQTLAYQKMEYQPN